MQNLVKSRKASYRQRFGNIGKLLVMEPPAPELKSYTPPATATSSVIAVTPTSPPHLVTVGVQYDSSASPKAIASNVLIDPFDGGCSVQTSLSRLPHPLEPSPAGSRATKKMDFDMADGASPQTLSNCTSTDSLEQNGSANPHQPADRMSVDLADISLSVATEAALHGVSEASDSGFSRSCASESTTVGVPDGEGEDSHPAVFSDVTSNSTTPDEGIEDPEPKMNGLTPTEEGGHEEGTVEEDAVEEEMEMPQPQPPDDVTAVHRERQPSEGSLNDSITSSSQSSTAGSQDRRQAANNTAPVRSNARLKGKFSHVTARTDSGRRRVPAAPGKKRVHFEALPQSPRAVENERDGGEAEGEEEDGEMEEEEEVFVIHHGPGYEEPAERNHDANNSNNSNNSSSGQRIVSFQEPRSLVKQYIKGRPGPGTRMKPRIIKQTTIETAELARKPQRAIPVPITSTSGGVPNIPVKQTNASKKRLEKLRQESAAQLERLQAESSYMTPLQRKEMEVKELRRQLGEAYYIIEQREIELDVFHHEKEREVRFVVEEKNDVIKELEESSEMLHIEVESVREEMAQLQERKTELLREIADLKEEAEKKEQRHQQLYLEMYKKGRDSAMFEREDELENLALEESNNVTKEELLRKLSHTQSELEHWQMVKLAEHYDEAAKPETEAEAMLNFLKDSMFHYLTDTKREGVDQHLRAIIRIFNFTDVQMKSINKCLEERKRKGKL